MYLSNVDLKPVLRQLLIDFTLYLPRVCNCVGIFACIVSIQDRYWMWHLDCACIVLKRNSYCRCIIIFACIVITQGYWRAAQVHKKLGEVNCALDCIIRGYNVSVSQDQEEEILRFLVEIVSIIITLRCKWFFTFTLNSFAYVGLALQ